MTVCVYRGLLTLVDVWSICPVSSPGVWVYGLYDDGGKLGTRGYISKKGSCRQHERQKGGLLVVTNCRPHVVGSADVGKRICGCVSVWARRDGEREKKSVWAGRRLVDWREQAKRASGDGCVWAARDQSRSPSVSPPGGLLVGERVWAWGEGDRVMQWPLHLVACTLYLATAGKEVVGESWKRQEGHNTAGRIWSTNLEAQI